MIIKEQIDDENYDGFLFNEYRDKAICDKFNKSDLSGYFNYTEYDNTYLEISNNSNIDIQFMIDIDESKQLSYTIALTYPTGETKSIIDTKDLKYTNDLYEFYDNVVDWIIKTIKLELELE